MIGALTPRPVIRADAPQAAASQPPVQRIDSATLLGGSRELIIEHGVDAYRLRLTSKGKLILTK
jgi:hemin uptake protein HemP